MLTSCPALVENLTPTVIIAALYSSAFTSFGTPTRILNPLIGDSGTLVAAAHHIYPTAQHQKTRHVDSCKRSILTMRIADARCPFASSRPTPHYRTIPMIQTNTPTKPRLLVLDED